MKSIPRGLLFHNSLMIPKRDSLHSSAIVPVLSQTLLALLQRICD